MDLLDMGRSIHDIGYRLRWSDVKTIVQHLPSGSHFRAHMNPEQARVGPYSDPYGQLLSMVVDELIGLRFQLAGAGDQTPPPLLDRLSGVGEKKDDLQERERPEVARRRPQASSSELRQRVAASMT